MLKLVLPDSFGFDEPILELVKVSSRGLIGNDRSQFVKRASSNILSNIDELIKSAKADEPLLHLIAMGATEYTGPNRNGDGWTSDTLRKTHDTFVKHAMFYRDHKNKDKTKSYGRVIKSAFNEANPRVELIVALNGSEQAAKRNNGLFADKELQKLASGQEMPVSMACMLPADSCSYCGNMAPSPSDYCLGTDEGGHCKAGGLRNRMGSLVDVDGDLHHLHANNPAPGLRFFDISKVFRPADRTAYAVGQLTKAAAAAKQPIKSAELASAVGLTIPITLFEDIYENDGTRASLKIAQQLADIEADIEANITTGASFSDAYNSLAFSDKTAADNLTFVKLSQDNFSKFLGALSRNKICLPVAGWLQAFTGHSAEKCAHLAELVKPVLPGIYTRMLQDTQLVGQIKHSKYKPVFPHSADATYTAAQPQLQSFSVRKQDIEKRAISACLQLTRSTLVKEAGMLGAGRPTFAEGALLSLAKEYALYKLAFVASAECSPFEARMTVLDNYCT